MSMLTATTLTLLQNQFKHEMKNYFRYLQRSSWARFRGFEATADLFEKQACEEKEHADAVRHFIEDRNEMLEPSGFAFDEPHVTTFDELFTTSLAVERETTDALKIIYQATFDEHDYQAAVWAANMIEKQTAEENEFQTIIDRIVQRGGGTAQSDALVAFRSDLAAAHDIDCWIGGRA